MNGSVIDELVGRLRAPSLLSRQRGEIRASANGGIGLQSEKGREFGQSAGLIGIYEAATSRRRHENRKGEKGGLEGWREGCGRWHRHRRRGRDGTAPPVGATTCPNIPKQPTRKNSNGGCWQGHQLWKDAHTKLLCLQRSARGVRGRELVQPCVGVPTSSDNVYKYRRRETVATYPVFLLLVLRVAVASPVRSGGFQVPVACTCHRT
jgi:hypothetical protein